MAVKAGTAFVDIEGDFSALNKQMSSHFKKMDTQAAGAGKGIGRKLGAGIATGVGAAAKVGAVGVGLLTAEVIRATRGWSAHQAIVRRSNAVIKSTGGAANVTAKHVERMSDAIERQTGVDGDLIQSGANLLLTFTNIRNGVGKNNKIFDQATKTTVNMSKALGQDTKSSAIQLGKALNDPVKGITALSRVGVSFTEDQKKQIEQLVKGGKAMEAQKIILKELAREFPKVKATPFERLVVVGRQVEDTIGKAVLPAFNRLVRDVTPALQRIADKVEDIFGDKKLSIGEKLSRTFEAVKVEVQPLIDNLMAKLREADIGGKINELVKKNAPKVAEGLKDIGGIAASALWTGFKEAPLWAKVLGAGFVAKAIFGGGGGAGGGGAGGKYGAFTSAGGLAARAFRTAFEMGAIKLSVLKGSIGKVAGFFTQRGSTPANPIFVADIAGGGIGLGGKGGKGGPIPVPGGGKLLGKVKPFLKGVGKLGAIGAGVTFAVNLVDAKGNPIAAAINAASDLSFGLLPSVDPEGSAKRNLNLFQKDLAKLSSEGNIGGLKRIQDELNAFTKFDAPGGIEKARKDVEKMIEVTRLAKLGINVEIKTKEALEGARAVSTALERMKTGSSRSVSSLRTNVRFNMRLIKRTMGTDSAAAKEAISANFNAAISNIQRSMDEGTISVKEGTALIEQYMVRSMMNFGFTNKQALRYAKGQDPLTGKNMNAPLVGKQRGGHIGWGAPTGDSVHAMLERDEYVLNRKAVRRVGKAALDRLNFGDAPRFGYQRGGSVTGDTDVGAALLRALKLLSANTGTPIYIQSGGRTVAEQLAIGPSTAARPVAGPNGPHVRGVAADITPGYSAFSNTAGKYGLAFTVMPQEPWHIQLVDAVTAALPSIAPTINAGTIVGRQSSLRQIAQGAVNATAAGAQTVINSAFNSLRPETGEPTVAGQVTGNGSGLMKAISKDRGWNFADWWALDARESSHGQNLSNPTSTARLRGQFLSSNWGKYGPGSDPAKNPTMAQQIQSMALYIAERYGNPSRAWDFWQSNYPPGWYQRGGLVGMKAGGGVKKLKKQIKKGWLPSTKEINKVVTKIRATSKKGKLAGAGKSLRKTLINKIKGIDLPDDVKRLTGLENNVNRLDELQDYAGQLTDSEAIRTALETQQESLGRNLTTPEQDDIILSMLGRVQGKTQIDWLGEELSALGSWRNALISVQETLGRRLAAFVARITAARERAGDLKKAIDKEERVRSGLVNERKKTKSAAAKKRLTKKIEESNEKLGKMKLARSALVGPNGIISRLDAERDIHQDSLGEARTSLYQVQGPVAAADEKLQLFNLGALPLGRLLGDIFRVQQSLVTSGISSYRIPPSDIEPPTDDSKALLEQLLKEANLRTAVSQAQYDVFRDLPLTFGNFPFGGFFQEGGTVPGPVGAPRMIVAHGGEEVISNSDTLGGTHVSLHFASGMEWLKQFVDVRVENQTRAQGRRGERQLPGRPGILR